MVAPKIPPVGGFGGFLKETASKDPIGRVLTAVHQLGPGARMSVVATHVGLADDEFSAAVAEAEWGGLCKREKRDDGIYLVLTSQGMARAEAILSPY